MLAVIEHLSAEQRNALRADVDWVEAYERQEGH
jgi:hypothetical protein